LINWFLASIVSVIGKNGKAKRAKGKSGFSLPDFALEIIKAGGLLEHIKKKM